MYIETYRLSSFIRVAQRLDHLARGVACDARAGVEHDGSEPTALIQRQLPHTVGEEHLRGINYSKILSFLCTKLEKKQKKCLIRSMKNKVDRWGDCM